MTDFSEQQKQLKIQKGIRQAEDKLVSDIQDILDDKTSYGNLEESQFRNLLRVADSTESPEVIKNFLLYQVGRDRKWGQGQNSLAKKIINYISKEIHQKAKDIAKNANSEETNLIQIELVRRYLGYGARYLVYKNKGEN
ncbi:hypothetical protein NIES267_25790 [Calothrix parasitica NIES-267]|uniref:CRISPR type III A-associated protein Csm2 n=1 Tax=Calothrix parasitica NIES-267 TaxID=1973488 RepID=A0A1Z4LPG0_9CYAN|nr:hypothetical protein NIES267_25790 [Calothrix parasitica NIES-267]